MDSNEVAKPKHDVIINYIMKLNEENCGMNVIKIDTKVIDIEFRAYYHWC